MDTITVSGAYVVAPNTELDFADTSAFFINQTQSSASPSLDNYGDVVVTDGGGGTVSAVANSGSNGFYGGPLTNESGAVIRISATGAGSIYAFSSGSWSLNIFNKGLVDVEAQSGAAYGFNSWSPGFLVDNSGTLKVVSNGASAYGTQIINGGSVTNSGSISVTGSGAAYGVWIDRFEAGSNGGRGTVINSGSIVATSTGGAALSVGIQATGLSVTYGGAPNVITNTATGVITAGIAISVGIPGSPSFQEPDVAITNAGVINGDIDTGDAVATITNTGSINGNINIGSATTTVDLRGGVLSGNLFIDPSRSSSAINDVIYEGATGGSVTIGNGNANAHTTIFGSASGGATEVFMPGSIANATLVVNSDGSATVNTLVGGSATVTNVDEVKFIDGAFFTDVNSGIINAYEVGFGRAPNAAELSYWSAHVGSISGLPAVMTAILNDPAGQAYTSARISAEYQEFFGRGATPSEIAVWQNDFIGGADTSTLKAVLLSTPEGRGHTTTAVTSLYDTYMGRDPSSHELSVWSGLIAGGDDFNSVRSALLSDVGGQAHTVATVTTLYDDFFGRDPASGELAVWQGLIAGGDTFADVQHALIADPASQVAEAGFIDSEYDAYFGRDATSSEVSVWQGLLAGGATPAQFKLALLSDPGGAAYTDPKIAADYQTYMGRAPTSGELGVWHGLFANGAGYDQLVDALLKGNDAVPHDVSNGWYDQFVYGQGGSSGYLTIDNFSVGAHDSILMSQSAFGSIDPLDAQHARQITALDGSPEVLVTLDATHGILFEHTTLSSLNDGIFNFQ